MGGREEKSMVTPKFLDWEEESLKGGFSYRFICGWEI